MRSTQKTMPFLYNKESTSKARALRKQQTDTERFLWSRLRGKQLAGHKFYRQYPIGKYIVDFYCPAKKLAIELDGSQHMQQMNYDKIRSQYLQEQQIITLRFWDNEVLKNINGVLEKINSLLTSP